MNRYRINEVKIGIFDEPAQALEPALYRRLKKTAGRLPSGFRVSSFTVARESVDARKKDMIRRVYTLDIETPSVLPLKESPDLTYHQIIARQIPSERPVVVGAGPCGLFCALILARGGLRPLVLERGRAMEERVIDVERYWKEGVLDESSNVQFGEGGAGTFSDGKLTTGIRDPRVRKVLEEFVAAGADPSILYKQRPHLGTDRLRQIIPAIRREIETLGGEFRFEAHVTAFSVKEENDGRIITGVRTADGNSYQASSVILAVGHSARDIFAQAAMIGLPMEMKPFSIGVRIEHPQAVINQAMYGGRWAEIVPVIGPADYKMAVHKDGKGIYTFCMCPGGEVVMSASERETIVTNGMSYSDRGGQFANSALLVDVKPADLAAWAKGEMPGRNAGAGTVPEVLTGAAFQQCYEKLAYQNGQGKAPKTILAELSDSAVARSLPSYVPYYMDKAMPVFGSRLAGFDAPDAVLTGVETRSSSPVRILRDEETLQSTVNGLYPAGEGAGYAGGITSAAVDGIRIAEAILRNYAH